MAFEGAPDPAATGLAPTLVAALARNAAEAPDQVAWRERRHGIWREWTWAEALDEVLSLAAGFEALGLEEHRALTVAGDNRVAIYLTMLAAGCVGAFPSPVYPDLPLADLEMYTQAGLPDIALAEDQEQVDKLLALRARTGRPSVIVYEDPRGVSAYPDAGLRPLASVTAEGRRRRAAEPGLDARLLARPQAGDVAVLLHTSGTTGRPKGIPLRHRNVLSAVAHARDGGYFGPAEEIFAYLPTAWVGDYVFTLGAGVALRAVVNVPERQETALHDLREVSPSFYFAAPRAWDAMLTRVQVGMADSTPLKRWCFDRLMPRAVEIERRRLAGQPPSAADRVMRAVAEVVICAPLKDFLGLSRARRAFTGGEAIGEETLLFFRALGVPLKQFYGQTETCALTAAQSEETVRLVGVGRPMPGVDLRLSEAGEILVRSPSVFEGYWENPEATEEALQDGWLATGDAGRIEPDGSLVVLGRLGELAETSAGERFIATFIENQVKFSPHVRNVAVLGAGRPDLTAIVCIDDGSVGHWAETRAIAWGSYAELSQLDPVRDLVAEVIARVNAALPEGLRIRRFVNLHKDFDADDGEITRTRKLRRKVIGQRYASLIEALYDGSASVVFEATLTYEDGTEGVLRRDLAIREVRG